MVQPGELVSRGPAGADRRAVLTAPLADWIADALGHRPADLSLFERALTHGSVDKGEDYQRLEFLGDRVLGLAVATMLYEAVPQEPEGSLSKRLAMLVSGASCAEVARAIGAGPHIRMGKQARDDGARDSVNVLGDVVEALIGALYLDGGLDAATAFVRRAWEPRMRGTPPAPQHPKSALQEWAAANRRRPPVYLVVDRSGPGHAPKFVVQVEIGAAGSARGEGSSKQDAETAAAAALLRQLRNG